MYYSVICYKKNKYMLSEARDDGVIIQNIYYKSPTSSDPAEKGTCICVYIINVLLLADLVHDTTSKANETSY